MTRKAKAKVIETTEPTEALAEQAAPAPTAYEVQINNGNEPGRSIASLDELGAIATAALIDGKRRSVIFRVTALLKQGENGAERVDGVK